MMFFFTQKTAYEMRMSDWSSDVCSSDLKLRQIVRHQIIAQTIACIDRRPQLRAVRDHCQSSRITQATGVNANTGAIRVEFENVRPLRFGLHPAIGDIAAGANRHVELATVSARDQIARPVAIVWPRR